MHASAFRFASAALHPDEICGKTILEAGGMDVNGTVRPVVESHGPAAYTATDMRPGPGVDVVCTAEGLPARFGADCADAVICTEMLEHAQDWQAALGGMLAVLRPGGVLVLTTRSEGFPLHGYPDDHWRFSLAAMFLILAAAGLTGVGVFPDPDPASPGVFARAVKPDGWKRPDGLAEAWAAAGVTGAPRG